MTRSPRRLAVQRGAWRGGDTTDKYLWHVPSRGSHAISPYTVRSIIACGGCAGGGLVATPRRRRRRRQRDAAGRGEAAQRGVRRQAARREAGPTLDPPPVVRATPPRQRPSAAYGTRTPAGRCARRLTARRSHCALEYTNTKGQCFLWINKVLQHLRTHARKPQLERKL